ncbi:MAG: hypothetical protein E7289_06435 [Lachnospiraceae bacterium]|nr:hypothetical protein [Lachnospiraceae bacterium]
MDFAGKSICLTKMEFDILASAMGLQKMVCFQAKEEVEMTETPQERYNRSVFALHKRGILIPDKEGFLIQESVEDIFRTIKACKVILTADSNLEEASQACLYFDDETVVTAVPGTRKDEYIKMSCSDIRGFGRIIMERGFLLEEMLPEGLRELQADEELYGISTEQLEKAKDVEELLGLQGVKTVFTIYQGEKRSFVGIIGQPLQDKIFIKEDKEVAIKTYSIRVLEETLENYYL